MRAAGSPAGDFDTWAAGAADCAHALLGRVRGALPMLASAPGPGWRGAPWGRRQTRPAGFGEWPGGPGGPWRGWWPGSPGFPRGPKASRGDVRAAILALLREGPRNGYQIMSEIEERSGGAWPFAQAAQLAGSIVQMAHVGTPGQVRAAEALLEQTRREMYQILGGGEGSEQDREQE